MFYVLVEVGKEELKQRAEGKDTEPASCFLYTEDTEPASHFLYTALHLLDQLLSVGVTINK